MRSRFAQFRLFALIAVAGCATVEEPSIVPGWSEADAVDALSHADCVRMAAGSAPTAAAWRARLLAAQAALEQAGRAENPVVSLGWEGLGLAGSPVQHTLSLAQSLASLASRPRAEAAARHDLDATRCDLMAERARLAADVCRAYDDLVDARARIALAADFEAIAERARAAAERFVAAGEKARFELDRADAERMKASGDHAAARTAARSKELALAFAVGFDRPVSLRLGEGLTRTTAAAPGDLLAAAQARPEIAAATARYEAQLERAHLASSGLRFLPSVSPGIRREGKDKSALLSLDVELPLLDDGSAAQHAASADLLAAAAELRRVVREAGNEVAAAAERAAAAESFLADHAGPLAKARRDLREKSERLFAEGELSFDEVIAARRDEIEARASLLDAELAAARARVDLAAATGTLLGGDGR